MDQISVNNSKDKCHGITKSIELPLMGQAPGLNLILNPGHLHTFTQFAVRFSGHISLRADVYKPFRDIVNHITPYTTWVMRVAEERSTDIDVSGVISLTMRLDGSAVDSHGKIPEMVIEPVSVVMQPTVTVFELVVMLILIVIFLAWAISFILASINLADFFWRDNGLWT